MELVPVVDIFAMAGGFVSHEALNKIGRDYDRKLKELFMKTIRKNRGV